MLGTFEIIGVYWSNTNKMLKYVEVAWMGEYHNL